MDVKDPIAKIMFCSDDNEEILAIKDTLKNHPLADKFDFIRSASNNSIISCLVTF